MKLTQTQFIILDTETTGKNQLTGESEKVIEIAGLRWVYNRKMEVLHFKENFVNPKCLIDPSSMAVHHISNDDVKNAPFIEEIDEEWDQWVGQDIIIAYNSDFDKTVLSNTGLNNKNWLDAYRMAMHFWSIGDVNEDGFPLTSLKQQELRYWLKLPKTFGDAHRAAADIQVTAHFVQKVIEKYLECGFEDDLNAFVKYINDPICHVTLPLGNRAMIGKTPDQIEQWAIKKAFDPTNEMFNLYKKFNVHDCLLPEYQKHFGKTPNLINQNKSKSIEIKDVVSNNVKKDVILPKTDIINKKVSDNSIFDQFSTDMFSNVNEEDKKKWEENAKNGKKWNRKNN